MNHFASSSLLLLIAALVCGLAHRLPAANCQGPTTIVTATAAATGQSGAWPTANSPYYFQSPLGQPDQNQSRQQQQQQPIYTPKADYSTQQLARAKLQPTAQVPKIVPLKPVSSAREIGAKPVAGIVSNAAAAAKQPGAEPGCLYDRRYFARLDECLSRRPYPTVGLAAFKNEDLLIKRGLHDRHGCVFVLNNGLFKSYQLADYSLDSDSQCLDGSKVGLSLSFTNVTLSYLWSLRCLNRADQLLDDATLDGQTTTGGGEGAAKETADVGGAQQAPSVCVGSSQNFGFTSLQLTGIEAQVELATDIYKNWRVTNVTVAMLSPSAASAQASAARSASGSELAAAGESQTSASLESASPLLMGTSIKDFVFESLDGDELNWRYLHLFQNWSRNRMHTNFLDQYRRFMWISLQRCLSEAGEKLPVKLQDVFTNYRYT